MTKSSAYLLLRARQLEVMNSNLKCSIRVSDFQKVIPCSVKTCDIHSSFMKMFLMYSTHEAESHAHTWPSTFAQC